MNNWSVFITYYFYFSFLFQLFGAMTSCALKVSDHFYGTGESFLFTFNPEFKVSKCYQGYFKNNRDMIFWDSHASNVNIYAEKKWRPKNAPKKIIGKIFKGETFINTLPTPPLKIFCKIILKFSKLLSKLSEFQTTKKFKSDTQVLTLPRQKSL